MHLYQNLCCVYCIGTENLVLQVCPSLLIKKDRGRPSDQKAKPKAFGEVQVASNIPGVELLEQEDQGSSDENMDGETSADDIQEDYSDNLVEEDGSGESDDDFEHESDGSDYEVDDGSDGSAEDEVSDEDNNDYRADGANEISDDKESEENADSSGKYVDVEANKSKEKKRKFSDFEGELNAANKSLRALKKLAGENQNTSSNTDDGILSNEDFQRIRELKVCAS